MLSQTCFLADSTTSNPKPLENPWMYVYTATGIVGFVVIVIVVSVISMQGLGLDNNLVNILPDDVDPTTAPWTTDTGNKVLFLVYMYWTIPTQETNSHCC